MELRVRYSERIAFDCFPARSFVASQALKQYRIAIRDGVGYDFMMSGIVGDNIRCDKLILLALVGVLSNALPVLPTLG